MGISIREKEDRHNHTLLLKELREGLDTISAHKYRGLSIAAGSKSWYFDITELTESVRYLDYVNLMTYDINANEHVTMHHTCPAKMNTELVQEGSTEENIELFIKKGVPPEKLIIGAAFTLANGRMLRIRIMVYIVMQVVQVNMVQYIPNL